MEYRVLERNGEAWIVISGALDAVGTLKAQETATHILDGQARSVTFDFKDLGFIDPSGIGFLVFLYKRLRTMGRSLKIVGLCGQPARLLRKLNLDGPLNATVLNEHVAVNSAIEVEAPLLRAS